MKPPMPAVVSVLLIAQGDGFVREIVLDPNGNMVNDFTLPLHKPFDAALIRENREAVRHYAEEWQRTASSQLGYTFTEIRSITVMAGGRVLYCSSTEAPEPTGKVVHCMREPFDIYIGRRHQRFPCGSEWGNPYVIGRHGNRSEVLAKYRAWVPTQPHLMAALPQLFRQRLGCWCKPHACHGDVLLELAEQHMRKAGA